MMLFLEGRSILPVRRPNGAKNKTMMFTPSLSKCKLSKVYIVTTSHCKPAYKMHHRIKDSQATHLLTIVLLTTVWKQESRPCVSKSPYNKVSSHHKDKKNLSEIQRKLYLNRAFFQLTAKNRHRSSQKNQDHTETLNIMKFNEVNKVLVGGNVTFCLR